MLKIDHIMLRTANLERSINFYRRVLGMEIETVDNHEADGYILTFLKDPESGILIELTCNTGIDGYIIGNTFDHIGFRSDNALSIHKKALQFGCEAKHKIHESSHNKSYIIVSIKSPEGIIIAVVQKIEDNNEDQTACAQSA